MNGVHIDTYIKLESCDIQLSIVDDMAELQFGGTLSDSLTITATEAGLAHLINTSTLALTQLHAARDAP